MCSAGILHWDLSTPNADVNADANSDINAPYCASSLQVLLLQIPLRNELICSITKKQLLL